MREVPELVQCGSLRVQLESSWQSDDTPGLVRLAGDTSVVRKGWWHLCMWSSVEASGMEEWKRSGGGAGSLLGRCLPSSGVLSPYKEIVVDSVVHRCACNPRLKVVGRDE